MSQVVAVVGVALGASECFSGLKRTLKKFVNCFEFPTQPVALSLSQANVRFSIL